MPISIPEVFISRPSLQAEGDAEKNDLALVVPTAPPPPASTRETWSSPPRGVGPGAYTERSDAVVVNSRMPTPHGQPRL